MSLVQRIYDSLMTTQGMTLDKLPALIREHVDMVIEEVAACVEGSVPVDMVRPTNARYAQIIRDLKGKI